MTSEYVKIEFILDGNHYTDNEQMANLHHPKLLDLSMETITSPNKQTTNHSWVFKLQLEKL